MLSDLNALFEEQIKDLYNAENQLIKALPRMAKAASSDALKEAFTLHLEETKGHAEQVAKIAQMLEFKPSGKVCKAMKGLLEEGKEAMEEDGEPPIIDAALIAAAQRVEHYEISAYGTARAIAERLGQREVVDLLQAILDQEEATDEKLTRVCQDEVFPAAEQGAQEDEEEESGEGGGGGGRQGSTATRKKAKKKASRK
jgi:ferritin-like metal-binding protein YciE